jgi:hypothetical protein
MQEYKWFRFHTEFSKDPKVQSMSEALQRRLVMLFCLECSGELAVLSKEEIAFFLRINDETLHETFQLFQDKGFLDENLRIKNWKKRQYASDTSTDRVKKFREKQRLSDMKRFRNVTVTSPDTETDTETDIKENIKRKKIPIKPDDVSQDVWESFIQHRKEKKAPLTDLALKGILKESKKVNWSLEEALTEICNRGWQGFNAEWVKPKQSARPQITDISYD